MRRAQLQPSLAQSQAVPVPVPWLSSRHHRRADSIPSGFSCYLCRAVLPFLAHPERDPAGSLRAGTRPRWLLNYILTRLIHS